MALFQSRFRRGILPRDFARYEALRDISCFQIEMPVDRADLSRDVEAGNRSFHGVEHALLEGRREVLLLMQRMLEIDSRDLRQFVEVKDE